jgi:hypothetical protein
MMNSLIALSTLSIAFSVALTQSVPLTDGPTADEIVKQALARAEAQYQSLVEAAFESKVIFTTKSLDANNKVTGTDWSRRRQYPLSGALFEETVEKNGKPLTGSELSKEARKKEDFIREVAKRVARGEHPQPEKEPGIRFSHGFVDRYRVKKVRVEMVRGHQCWVISFEPKDGKLPVRNRMDQALNHSTGRFWISQDDYGLARIEFSLRKPFKYWGGFLAVIRSTDGRLEYQRFEPNIWMPVDFDLKLDLEIMMVKDIRRHIVINWSEYKRSAGTPVRPRIAMHGAGISIRRPK